MVVCRETILSHCGKNILILGGSAMTSLASNITNRIQRLPKPSSAAQALQPLFEAISNSVHAVQARFSEEVADHGQIRVLLDFGGADEDPLRAVVEDNGIGLDDENYDAFLTTDTDYKLQLGGKGVGRLLWLDCFEKILIESVYARDGQTYRRTFQFQLTSSDQITDETIDAVSPETYQRGTRIEFEGLRQGPYAQKFPKQKAAVVRHLMSHFLPTFVGGSSPKVMIDIGDDSHEFPTDVEEYVLRQEESNLELEDYGSLSLTLMECNKAASADLPGNPFLHFIAHNRTVLSHRLDGRLGLKTFGDEDRRVFHGCVAGAFLDDHVNQERTQFNFSSEIVEDSSKKCSDEAARPFLSVRPEKS